MTCDVPLIPDFPFNGSDLCSTESISLELRLSLALGAITPTLCNVALSQQVTPSTGCSCFGYAVCLSTFSRARVCVQSLMIRTMNEAPLFYNSTAATPAAVPARDPFISIGIPIVIVVTISLLLLGVAFLMFARRRAKRKLPRLPTVSVACAKCCEHTIMVFWLMM